MLVLPVYGIKSLHYVFLKCPFDTNLVRFVSSESAFLFKLWTYFKILLSSVEVLNYRPPAPFLYEGVTHVNETVASAIINGIVNPLSCETPVGVGLWAHLPLASPTVNFPLLPLLLSRRHQTSPPPTLPSLSHRRYISPSDAPLPRCGTMQLCARATHAATGEQSPLVTVSRFNQRGVAGRSKRVVYRSRAWRSRRI